MSKIEKELQKATDVTPKRGEDTQTYLQRLVVAVGELDDKAWEKLSEPAQDWTNAAADAGNKKKDLPGFPDAEKVEEAEEKPSRRRVKADEDDEPKKGKPYAPEKGDEVIVTTKRGKTYEGEVVEVDAKEDLLVLKVGKEEVELTLSTSTVEPLKSDAAEAEVVDPKKGDTVEVVTKRGKTVVGNVVEIDDKILVLKKADDEEVEFDQDRIESIVVKVAAAAGSKRRKADDEEEEKPARRGSKDEDKGDEKEGKRTRASNGDISVGTRIRELIVDDFDLTVEGVGKVLKKEGLEFRENTLKLVYADTHKIINLLSKAKKLK